MAILDFVKEQINYLKLWLGIFVVTLIGLMVGLHQVMKVCKK